VGSSLLGRSVSILAVEAIEEEDANCVNSGITFAAAIFRFVLPESDVFLRARAEEQAQGIATSGSAKSKAFLVSAKDALKQYWPRCIYAVILMSFFNFFS
jgi:SHS family lactate transporter-like MFS transporter